MSGVAAYQNAVNADPRKVEADLFRRIVFGLRQAKQTKSLPAAIKSIVETRVLWTALLNDINQEGNRLPQELKRGLGIVGLSILKEIDNNEFGSVDLDFLIEVNQQVLGGLEADPA